MPQQLDIYRGKGETKIVVSSSFGTLSSPFQRICKYNQFSLLSPPFFPRRIPQAALHFHVFYHGWRRFVCQNLVQCFLNEICHVCFFYHVPDLRKKQGRESNPRHTRLTPYTPHTFVWNGLEPLSPVALPS
jgi:hypothetical protein